MQQVLNNCSVPCSPSPSTPPEDLQVTLVLDWCESAQLRVQPMRDREERSRPQASPPTDHVPEGRGPGPPEGSPKARLAWGASSESGQLGCRGQGAGDPKVSPLRGPFLAQGLVGPGPTGSISVEVPLPPPLLGGGVLERASCRLR